MIILGDIASPNIDSSLKVKNFIDSLNLSNDQAILFNLEGLITDSYKLSDNKPILFNHSSILDSFDDFKVKIAALANNHTLDLPEYLEPTKNQLNSRNYLAVGAGDVQDEDFEVISFYESGFQVFVINACWSFLLYHQNNNNPEKKVNTIDEERILQIVKKIKAETPDAKIVTYFHWSFDLETLPSPSYRLFSQHLIDSGVSLVVGGHSHCVQGGEMYKNGLIVYGLGNFHIPSGVYANGKLKFPQMSHLGWMLQWDIKENRITNYWVNSADNNLEIVAIDLFNNSKILKEHSLYSKFDNKTYIPYFKRNRRKNLLNPIFIDYKKSITNSLRMNFLILRAKFARRLAEMNLIKWQN
ncbi:CapA family protein [Aequorivita marina]|uniref:CapA family protein n=1 Tax=Aequorivita marina TaxID=3073654 RepID=UPI002875F214|nr:CapA family protein [Aequorivita sp. S2608]MDS1299048.1 CapA family protein [Aequorivita sp. S2608]